MHFGYLKLTANIIGVEYTVFLWWMYLDEAGASVLQTEVCCSQQGPMFGLRPPFLSCQLKSHKPLQMMRLFLDNPCPASSTD